MSGSNFELIYPCPRLFVDLKNKTLQNSSTINLKRYTTLCKRKGREEISLLGRSHLVITYYYKAVAAITPKKEGTHIVVWPNGKKVWCVDSHQGKNGKHPHVKNAGIVFHVGYFPFICKKGGNIREAISNNLLIILISMRKCPRTIS